MPDRINAFDRLLRDIRITYGYKTERINTFYQVLVALPPAGYRHFSAAAWEPVYRLLRDVDAAMKAARERNKNGSQTDRRNKSIAAMDALLNQHEPEIETLVREVLGEAPSHGGRIGSYLDQEINRLRQCYGDIPSTALEAFVDRLKNPPADVPKTRIFKGNPAFLAFAQEMQDLGRRVSEVRAQSASEGLSPAETGKHMDRVLLAASDPLCQEMIAVRHYLVRLSTRSRNQSKFESALHELEKAYEGIPSRGIAIFPQKLEDPTDVPRFRYLETATSFATFLQAMHRLTEHLKEKRVQCAEAGLSPPDIGTQMDEILHASEESLEALIWEARRHIAEAHPLLPGEGVFIPSTGQQVLRQPSEDRENLGSHTQQSIGHAARRTMTARQQSIYIRAVRGRRV